MKQPQQLRGLTWRSRLNEFFPVLEVNIWTSEHKRRTHGPSLTQVASGWPRALPRLSSLAGMQELEGRSEQAAEKDNSEKQQQLKSEEDDVDKNLLRPRQPLPCQAMSRQTCSVTYISRRLNSGISLAEINYTKEECLWLTGFVMSGMFSQRCGESLAKHLQIFFFLWKIFRIRTTSLHILLLLHLRIKQLKEWVSFIASFCVWRHKHSSRFLVKCLK